MQIAINPLKKAWLLCNILLNPATRAVNLRYNIFESIAGGAIVTDIAGNITLANSAAARLYGFETDHDMLGLSIFNLVARKDNSKARQNLKKMLQFGHSQNLEYASLRKDGHKFAAEMNVGLIRDKQGDPEGFVAIIKDITTHKRRELKLKQSEEKYKTLFETRIHGAVVIDQNMKLLMINRAGAEMFGFSSPEEALGIDIFDYIAPEEHEETRRIIVEDMFGKGNRRVHEFRTFSKDGNEIWINAEGGLTEYQGKIVGLVTFRDITERKRAEAQLLAYQRELRALASELSLAEERERRRIAIEIHDRATQTLALCSIRLGELLQSPSCASFVKPLSEIHSYVKDLIDETRSLAFQLSSPLLYEVGLEPALEYLAEQIHKDHSLVCKFDDDGQYKPLEQDVQVILFQVVRELLVNVGKHARASNAWIQTRSHNGCIEITVEDNGIGFDASKFGSDRKTVAGFGLFSIRERLRNLGGSLKVESEPGRGTRAIMLAPLKSG